MKAIIRFILTLAVGILIGYLLAPTIDGLIDGTKAEKAVDATAEVANEALQNKIDSIENKE